MKEDSNARNVLTGVFCFFQHSTKSAGESGTGQWQFNKFDSCRNAAPYQFFVTFPFLPNPSWYVFVCVCTWDYRKYEERKSRKKNISLQENDCTWTKSILGLLFLLICFFESTAFTPFIPLPHFVGFCLVFFYFVNISKFSNQGIIVIILK